MKRFTGTILLTATLLTHVAIAVATEKSYIFSSTEYSPAPANPAIEVAEKTQISGPASNGSFMRTTGFYAIDDNFIVY